MNGNSNERATNLPQQTFNHVPAGTTQWSVQGSNLRPPDFGSYPNARGCTMTLSQTPLKSRLSPRKDGETAHPTDNQTAIGVSQLSRVRRGE